MNYDIADFHDFYKSRLGKQAQEYIAHAIQSLWPDAVDDVVIGYGFTIPYLEFYRQRAQGVFALMPCTQGAIGWTLEGLSQVALTPPNLIPLQENSVDRLLLIHSLEHSNAPLILLREAWRILRDGGHLLIIVPNRRGFWSRYPSTPFGLGEPYSGRQLYSLVEQSLFTPFKPFYSLYTPPILLKYFPKCGDIGEYVGHSWIKKLGGITLLAAQKQTLSPFLKKPQLCPAQPLIPQAVS